ncbi:AAA family ATPase [Bacillus cereus group sp. BfR-BA-01355]|uniref:AAA family ATPase n=1 Tax=Bacillus cereus group sp. BfR-BA-01355 TaxID=2920318 RepID=UPI001F568B42|nr:AAA family ATPase [Bacillus cereus group sp. BfR-BA-01355]
MKRLVIITVGKTHSGKTTFAKELETELPNSFIMDQDNQAESLHEDVVDPVENEADYLLVIRNSKDVNSTILKIIHIAKEYSPIRNKRL